MSVFDGEVKVPRAVADPKTDKDLPKPGALSWGGIKSPAGLASTTGADCKLIHGDRWQQLIGSQTENLTGSLLTNIMVNRTETVTGNHTNTTVGNVQTTTVGGQNHLYVGAKNDVNVAPHNRLNASPEAQQEPTMKTRIFGVVFEKKDSEQTITTNKVEIVTLGNAFTAFKNEGTLISNDVKVVALAAVLGIAVEPKLSEVELKPLHVFMEGGHAELTAGKATVAPGVNAVPGAPTLHQ